MPQPSPWIQTETLLSTEGQAVSFDLVAVQGGAFEMGGADKEAYDDELPIHRVQVPDFWMGKFPVTQELWQAVLGENPAYFPGPNRPVENVSWLDITERFLPALYAATGRPYRLPSEAEWEYAARGGLHHSPYRYAGSNRLEDVAWYEDNSHNETKPVGLKQPNALGIYDLSGNVWEWCADHWHSNYEGAPTDGSAWVEAGEEGRNRVLRGGSWFNASGYCRVSFRDFDDPGRADDLTGFRLVVSSWQ